MPKPKSRHDSILHSLPSFNKCDRLSVKVASLRLAEHLSDSDPVNHNVDRRRCSPHRRTLGGRGREWAAESLKLLEALLELEDSQPIREPVNPLKFPDYYSQVANPLDLSKIMLKFHGGSYESVDAFAKDMRMMFGNYKGFFKDASSEIYTQVHRLSWWFEAEITRIMEKWGRKYNPMILPKMRKMAAEAAASQDPEEKAKDAASVASVPLLSEAGSQEQDDSYQPSTEGRRKRKRPKEPEVDGNSMPVNLLRSRQDDRISALNVAPLPTAKDHRSRIGILSHSRTNSEPLPTSLARLKPGTLAQLKGAQNRLTVPGVDQTFISLQDTSEPLETIRPPEQTKSYVRVPRLDVDVLTLELNVSNIWFGAARIKPKKQALLSETGLQVSLVYSDQETPFTIHSEEIVRCVGHFGRSSQKHTLFIFVLPSCSKRLEALNEKYVNTSMIVIFLNLPTAAQISTLIHIFWNIGKKSLFGSIFSEVDQQGALMLLGNIKPGILHRVTNKYKNNVGLSTRPVKDIPVIPGSTGDGGDTVSRILKKKRKTTAEIINRLTELQALNNSVNEEASTSNVTQSEPGPSESNIEPESSVMPDSSMSSSADPEPSTSSAGTSGAPPQHFDQDFAERLGASLQKGVKDGVTEVLKDWADKLYGKGLPTSGKDDVDEVLHAAKLAAAEAGYESDIEIVIPTDSEDEDSKKPTSQSDISSMPGEEEELAVTGEKLSIRCPITQQIMAHPMKNKHCNHSYDRQGVEELIKNRKEKAKCPVAGCSNIIPLTMIDMKYEYELWKYIQDKLKNPLFRTEEDLSS